MTIDNLFGEFELAPEGLNEIMDGRLKSVIEDRDKRLLEIRELQFQNQMLEIEVHSLKIGLIIFAMCIVAQAGYLLLSS